MLEQSFSSWKQTDLKNLLMDARVPFDSNRENDSKYLQEIIVENFIYPPEKNGVNELVMMHNCSTNERYRRNTKILRKVFDSLVHAINNLTQVEDRLYTVGIQDFKCLKIDLNDNLTRVRNAIQEIHCSIMFIGDTDAGRSKYVFL